MGFARSKHIFVSVFYILCCIPNLDTRNVNPLELANFTVTPSEDELRTLFDKDSEVLNVVFPHCDLHYSKFTVSVADERIMQASHYVISPYSGDNSPCYQANVTVTARNIGQSNVTFLVVYPTENDPCIDEVTIVDDYEVKIQRYPGIELLIFRYGTIAFLIVLNFGFGCSLDLEVVKEILKRPFAPAVGFSCQYFMMPIIGFCVGMTLLRNLPLFGFGLICSACSPGGSGSNVWCLLLGGDVSLSLTMTFFSISASLFMMPLWIYMEEGFFLNDVDVTIPYIDILKSLFMFVFPLFIGIIFHKVAKNGAELVGRFIKPFALLFLIFLLTFGLYTNRYVFSILAEYPFLLLPALLQPYLGFSIAFLIAKTLGQQPRHRAITIAIETGIQNIAIPMTLLQNSFEQPLGDLAAVMPVTTALFTPLPLMATFVFLVIRNRFCPKPKQHDAVELDTVDVKNEEELNKNVKPASIRDAQNVVNGRDALESSALMAHHQAADFSKTLAELDKETDI